MLKIIESYRQELNNKGIVICTYLDLQDNEIDCINIQYQEEYPMFEITSIKDENIEII